MLRTEVLKGADLFSTLRADWRDLVESSPGAGPFQTWEWQSTWFKHFGAGKMPTALVLREGNDLVGLMAFVKTTGPWRTMRPLGIGPSDYLRPLSREGFQEPVAEAVSDHLHSTTDVDLVDLHQLRENEPLASVCRPDARVTQARCLVLDLPSTYDEYLKMLGKSLRFDVRKLDKSLFSGGRATIAPVPRDEVRTGFETFLYQHRARWRKKRLPGAFLGRSLAFHREWIEKAAEREWLRLSLLRLDGQVIGAIYAMRSAGTVYYYQAGFDPDHSSVSPGTLLVAHTIRTAIEEGATSFDFMRGDEPYKRRWKPQNAWRNERLLFSLNPVRGNVGLGWNLMASGIEDRLRAKLEGHGPTDEGR